MISPSENHLSGIKSDLEAGLEKLPDEVADALLRWRLATLDREKTEALIYLKFKGEGEKRTADELKMMVRADSGRYAAVLREVRAESDYTRLYERLMSFKKSASLRTAF